MFQYLFVSVYFIAAIILPLTFVLMLWGAIRITGLRDQKFMWGSLIGILGVIPVLSDLTVTRGEFVDGVLKDVWTPPGIAQFIGDWGARGLTYLILGFALIVFFKSLQSRQQEKRTGTWLFVAYLALITPPFISSVVGTRPVFNHFMLSEPLIFALVYLSRPTSDWLWYVKQFKRVLIVYIVLSALFGVLVPSWTTGSAMVLIPGFSFRLNGIFSHSNSLGMAALVYLVLDMADETPKTLYRELSWYVTMGVLAATQSKTAWVGAVLAFAVNYIYKITALKKSGGVHSFMPALIGLGVVLAGVVGYLFFFETVLDHWSRGLDAETYNSLTSLTGRTNIWNITLHSWEENPIFGYGPGLWDIDYRLQYAPQYLYIVGMAHNQFIQTLGESGIVGVLGLSIYLLTLVKLGFQYFSMTRGVSLVIVVIFLARSMSETPFRNLELGVLFFVHFILIVLFMSMTAAKRQQQETLSLNMQGVFIKP